MAEESVESGQETPESQALPAPKISEPSAAQTSSPIDMAELAKTVAKALEPRFEALERASQSLKDKRLAKLETSVEEIATRFKIPPEELAQYERERKIDRILERDEALPKQEVGPSWQDEWQVGSEEILKKVAEDFGVKIDRNDPEFLEVQRGRYTSRAGAFAAITGLAARRLKQVSTPASAVASEGTGNPPVSDDHVALSKQLQEARARGASTKEIREITQKLRAIMPGAKQPTWLQNSL